MSLLIELRENTQRAKHLNSTQLSPPQIERIVPQVIDKWKEVWLGELQVAAGSGEHSAAISYGVLGEEFTPYRQRELACFLKENGLSFEEGRAHFVTPSEGEWRVEGILVARW